MFSSLWYCRLTLQRSKISLGINFHNSTRGHTDTLCRYALTLDSNENAIQVQSSLINPSVRNTLLKSLFWTNDLTKAKAPESFWDIPPSYRQERDHAIRIVVIANN